MKTVEPYRIVAKMLRAKIVEMGYGKNHFGSPGYFSAIEILIADELKQQDVAANSQTVSRIAQSFPLIDVDPELEGPDDDRVYKREIEQVAALVAHFLPDLK